MPSKYSTDISELCRHESWRVGCLSCKQHRTRRQCAEAKAKLRNIGELVKALEESEKQPNLPNKEKHDALDRQTSSQELVQALLDASNIAAQKVLEICAENEPDMLVDAFEQDAARREQEMHGLWGSKWPKFKTEDPTRTSSFKGLDRTKIPANPDYLVNDPIGLEIFLRLAKHRTPSHTMSAVGLSPGPAFISYGSAVAKYGPPEAPGEDWPSEVLIDGIVDRDSTAQEVSSASDNEFTPTLPKLSWAFFKESSFLEYTSLLVAEYAKLVREKSS